MVFLLCILVKSTLFKEESLNGWWIKYYQSLKMWLNAEPDIFLDLDIWNIYSNIFYNIFNLIYFIRNIMQKYFIIYVLTIQKHYYFIDHFRPVTFYNGKKYLFTTSINNFWSICITWRVIWNNSKIIQLLI